MIQLIDIDVEYHLRGKSIQALNQVNLTIPDGEFLAIIGPSGSGKSTFLQVLGGMLSPKKGQVLFDGISLYEKSTDQRAAFRKTNIGFVFQTFNLIPFLTAKQNVQMPLLLNRHPTTNQEERASQLLSRLGLADRLEHKPSELSVGQQQRVALARMLSNDPPIIIADEPTGSLDPDTSIQILDFLKELHQEGRTVIMVTHAPDAAKTATRCVQLVDGCINEMNIDNQRPITLAASNI